MTRMKLSVVTSCIGASASNGTSPRSSFENVADGITRAQLTGIRGKSQMGINHERHERHERIRPTGWGGQSLARRQCERNGAHAVTRPAFHVRVFRVFRGFKSDSIILAFADAVRNLRGSHERKHFHRHGQRRNHFKNRGRPGKWRGGHHPDSSAADQCAKRHGRGHYRMVFAQPVGTAEMAQGDQDTPLKFLDDATGDVADFLQANLSGSANSAPIAAPPVNRLIPARPNEIFVVAKDKRPS